MGYPVFQLVVGYSFGEVAEPFVYFNGVGVGAGKEQAPPLGGTHWVQAKICGVKIFYRYFFKERRGVEHPVSVVPPTVIGTAQGGSGGAVISKKFGASVAARIVKTVKFSGLGAH